MYFCNKWSQSTTYPVRREVYLLEHSESNNNVRLDGGSEVPVKPLGLESYGNN